MNTDYLVTIERDGKVRDIHQEDFEGMARMCMDFSADIPAVRIYVSAADEQDAIRQARDFLEYLILDGYWDRQIEIQRQEEIYQAGMRAERARREEYQERLAGIQRDYEERVDKMLRELGTIQP